MKVEADFVPFASKRRFNSGSQDGSTLCVDITFVDDVVLENSQRFTLHLTTVDDSVKIGTNTTVITIIDDDGVCML